MERAGDPQRLCPCIHAVLVGHSLRQPAARCHSGVTSRVNSSVRPQTPADSSPHFRDVSWTQRNRSECPESTSQAAYAGPRVYGVRGLQWCMRARGSPHHRVTDGCCCSPPLGPTSWIAPSSRHARILMDNSRYPSILTCLAGAPICPAETPNDRFP